ncbi:MAG: NTP transferase domain-containing protein [Ignavibacteriae bacterium]|nr:NTP transferase domain-containing protein [Ignavibacteriota bacterium]
MEGLDKFGVVILAAGESSRMSVPKPFLRYDSKSRFIDKIIEEYRYFGINNIVVVANNQNIDRFNLDECITVVVNQHLEYERFHSIKLGLEKNLNCDYCFIQNIDNPFVNEVILRKLYYKKIKSGSAVPEYNETGGHPVLIGKDIIKRIIESNGSILNFKDILSEFASNRVTVDDESVLININTPEEYRNYFK